jgi:hypothetical protein
MIIKELERNNTVTIAVCFCGEFLEICPANEPWNPEYMICPNCDSTYAIESCEGYDAQ